jgi:hypothetical protein
MLDMLPAKAMTTALVARVYCSLWLRGTHEWMQKVDIEGKERWTCSTVYTADHK